MEKLSIRYGSVKWHHVCDHETLFPLHYNKKKEEENIHS
jgi:hypothetical protein